MVGGSNHRLVCPHYWRAVWLYCRHFVKLLWIKKLLHLLMTLERAVRHGSDTTRKQMATSAKAQGCCHAPPIHWRNVTVEPGSRMAVVGTATRVASFGQSILDAHSFGFGPGNVDDLTSAAFHERAIGAIASSLPWPYLVAIGRHFAETASILAKNGSGQCDVDDWLMVMSFLRSASASLLNNAPDEARTLADEGESAFIVLDRSPTVTRFDLVAEISSQAGAEALVSAAVAVAAEWSDATEFRASSLGLSEIEIQLVRRLAAGTSVVDIGHEIGYSERSVYRKLDQIWRKIGAGSKSDGLVRLGKAGLL